MDLKININKGYNKDGIMSIFLHENGNITDVRANNIGSHHDNDEMDFVIQYLYSEHNICDPSDCAAPYTKDELKNMAIKILKTR